MTRFLDHPAILPGLVIAGAVFVVFQVMGAAAGQPFAAYDVHAYWLAGGSEHPYAGTIASGFDDSVNLYKYRYPPPLAQVFVMLHRGPTMDLLYAGEGDLPEASAEVGEAPARAGEGRP